MTAYENKVLGIIVNKGICSVFDDNKECHQYYINGAHPFGFQKVNKRTMNNLFDKGLIKIERTDYKYAFKIVLTEVGKEYYNSIH